MAPRLVVTSYAVWTYQYYYYAWPIPSTEAVIHGEFELGKHAEIIASI